MSEPKGNAGLETPEAFVRRLSLHFDKMYILRRALTHRSYLNENPDIFEDNERLEFLGDAVIDLIVAEWLYHRFPEIREGQMTRLRSMLVSREQLAAFAREIKLGPALFLGRGEEEGGGRNRDALLCAAFEALVGAYSIDQGLETARAFIEPLFIPIVEHIVREQSDKDPKSLLQEKTQAQGLGAPQYILVGTTGPDHDRTFTYEAHVNGQCVGSGKGKSKQAASKAAASDALQKLE